MFAYKTGNIKIAVIVSLSNVINNRHSRLLASLDQISRQQLGLVKEVVGGTLVDKKLEWRAIVALDQLTGIPFVPFPGVFRAKIPGESLHSPRAGGGVANRGKS